MSVLMMWLIMLKGEMRFTLYLCTACRGRWESAATGGSEFQRLLRLNGIKFASASERSSRLMMGV